MTSTNKVAVARKRPLAAKRCNKEIFMLAIPFFDLRSLIRNAASNKPRERGELSALAGERHNFLLQDFGEIA
jgi:hypothetical protein